MAHVTTPDEAYARVEPMLIRLAGAGFGEIATWVGDCARAVPYLTNENMGGLKILEKEIDLIIALVAIEGKTNGV